MRLIDADAEIARIEEEIRKLTKAIERWQARKLEGSTIYDIDAKIQELQNDIIDCRIEIRMLRNYTTAYDVEKVVEQLQRISDEAQDEISVCEKEACQYYDGFSDGVDKVIEIVKRGGRDEK